jgi:hypothetical protein
MFKLYCLSLFMLLNGCATCERHPEPQPPELLK